MTKNKNIQNIPASAIQMTPHFTTKIRTKFIEGISQIDDKLIIILDVDLILTEEEIESLDTIDAEGNTVNNPGE